MSVSTYLDQSKNHCGTADLHEDISLPLCVPVVKFIYHGPDFTTFLPPSTKVLQGRVVFYCTSDCSDLIPL